MRTRKSASNQVAKPTTYRITEADKKLLCKEHETVSAFLNKCVSSEVKRLQKKKGAKPKITKG